MKKIFLGSITLLLASSGGMFGAQPINTQQINTQLSQAGGQLTRNALNSSLPITEQNSSIDVWMNSFNTAKAFIINNSKNLVGVRDSDIINALNTIDNANNDIMNVIKITRALSATVDLKNQQAKLFTIQRNVVNAINTLNRVNMTLNNKKEAKSLIISMGRFLEQIIQRIDNNIQQKITSSTPALPPRGTTQPSAPSRPVPAAPKPVIGECSICAEERELVKVPCKNNHPDLICKQCLSQMKVCPFCRGPLSK